MRKKKKSNNFQLLNLFMFLGLCVEDGGIGVRGGVGVGVCGGGGNPMSSLLNQDFKKLNQMIKMVNIASVYGEWVRKDNMSWHFEVDYRKGGRTGMVVHMMSLFKCLR
ncbi:unnamed protein product [Microthlaspi erraticum]|uniref:Uncharacterized protein n=1 Tax=Microthlaspi erraticum TaxID=1685480 RepID=A0A6D2IIB5_9BRAS|nr:unnamed protein product [Microthlaspi erraticum]